MDSPSEKRSPSTPPAGETATPASRLNVKSISLWLAGPSALLVFINQVVPLWKAFKEPPAAENQATVVVEHRLPTMLGSPAKPLAEALTVEAARFGDSDGDKLDLVCRNSSDEPAFISQAIVNVVRVWKLKPIAVARGQLARSAEYDLTLPADAPGDGSATTIQRALNQEIPAGGLDRFALSIGVVASSEQCVRVYQFRVQLVSGPTTIDAGEFVYLSSPADGPALPPYSVNRTAATEIAAVKGTRNAALEKFLASAP